MDTVKVVEKIDKIASDLEEKGLLAEAARIDEISNTIEKEAEKATD